MALADARHDEAHAAQITPAVERSVVRVRSARSTLEQTTRRRGAAQPARAELRRLLVRYRCAWKSLRALVAAWALCEGLDADTQANVKAAVATLSSGGVGVLSGTEANVWSVGRRRIDALIEAKLDTVFDGLGLGVALRHVMALHAELGRALGITAKLTRKGTSKPPSESSAVRAARNALADYALKAQAMADDEVAGSRALVATLLAPLAALSGDARSARRRRRSRRP